MCEASLLIDFLEELNSHPMKSYSNDQKTNRKQSSVAMIFRCMPALEKRLNLAEFHKGQTNIFAPPTRTKLCSLFESFLGSKEKEVFELLFVERAITEKDFHSGEICFPGGKCEDQETDLDAAIREVKEEIDYDLLKDQTSLYLGRLPKNFYVYESRKGTLYVTVHLFLLLDYESASKNRKFNPREVGALKWLPLNNLLNPTKGTLKIKKVQAKKNLAQHYPKLIQSIFAWVLKDYQFSEYAGIDIEMGEPLYGLTFFMVIYVIGMIRKETVLTSLGGWAAAYWYRKHRIEQFHYKKSEGISIKIYVLVALLIFALILILWIV